jgi:putative phage-type endonuclease
MPQEVILTQGSQEWLDFRILHRMASETPAVMGVSPYQRPSDIRRIKNGGGSGFVNSAMRQGTAQEPIARAAYELDYEPMRPAVFVDGAYGASLDGINMDLTGIWEVKTPVDGSSSERWALAVKGELTPYDYAQVQHQLMVTQASWCHFCVWDVESQTYMLVHVKPDPDYWLTIEMEWDAFWENLGLRTDRAWSKAVKEYKEAKLKWEEATASYDLTKIALQELLVGEENEGGGVRVQRITVRGQTDWKKVKEHYCLEDSALEQFKKPDSTQVRINEIKE